MKRFRCKSYGRVQGVWYRRSVQQAAQAVGFKGWVRNLSDGSVESAVDVESDAMLKAFKEILYRGSPLSKVERVECEEVPIDVPYIDFEVR